MTEESQTKALELIAKELAKKKLDEKGIKKAKLCIYYAKI